MIETKVPIDLRKYKTKVFGPFTFRQVVCGSIDIVVDALVYFIFFSSMAFSVDMIRMLIFVIMLIDTPIFAFLFEVYGLPMEQFLLNIVFRFFQYPERRRQTSSKRFENQDNVAPTSKKVLKKKEKENPEIKEYK